MYKEFDYELNRTTHYEYDADGVLLRTYTIDADGKNILQIEYPQKGSADSSVRYIIDGVILDELDVTADEDNNTTTLNSHAGIVTTTSDDLGRVIGSILQTTEDFALMESYSYLNVVMTPGKADTSSSTYVSTLTMADGTVYGYSYDSIGNITRVTENGVLKLSYQYDGQGQLVREDNVYANATYAFTYDGYGNILTKSEYGYTAPDTELPASVVSTNTYSYENENWPDQLTAYNGMLISYDDIGNPLSYYNGKNFTFTWEGRTLVGATDGTNTYAYTYNSNGIRVEKVANFVVHKYTIDGTKILAETYGDTTLNFYYDENDSPIAFSVNGTMYYYGKNLQGDVVKLYTASGEVVAEYTYDAWGRLIAITDENGNAITDSTSPAFVNPIRYRGYYYDVETGFYYLNSRYYDSRVGRFLNSDDLAFLGVSGTTLGYNLYGYCENNVVCMADYSGKILIKVLGLGFYDTKKDIFYYSINAPQRAFGYCDTYDRLAGAVGINVVWLTAYFRYDSKDWRIEFWKGTYGRIYCFVISTGCEIGVYYRKNSYAKGWYKCADNNNTLKMSMTLFRNGRQLFVRKSTEKDNYKNRHWWLTGFKPLVQSLPKQLTMQCTIYFKDATMASAFRTALLKAVGNKGTGKAKSIVLNGTQVTFVW